MGKLVITWGTSIGCRSWMGKNGNLLRRWNSEKLSIFGSKVLELGHLANLELVQEYSSVVGVQFGFQSSGQCSSSLLWPLCLLLLLNTLFLQNQSVNPEMTETGARHSLYKRSPQWPTPQCAPQSRLTQLPWTADSPLLCKLGLCTRTSWAKFPLESEFP